LVESGEAGLSSHREDWLGKVFRRSHSDNSRHGAEMALKAFDRALGESAEVVIDRVKREEVDVYSVFDRFVADLDERGLSPNSIRGYVSRVMQYFAYNDVFLDKDVFRVKVGLPRVEEPDDRAPTVEELRKILSWGKLRTKTLMLVLASSGMRIGEAIKLHVKDVDFNSKPTKVTLSSEVASKTGERRITYISDEATEYLKRYLDERIHHPEAWLFVSEADNSRHVSDDRAWRTIINCVDKAGLGKSKETTMQGRRKIHPHSLRKFFFSKVVGMIGEAAAHALMGHSSYMKTYYRRTDEERAKDYLKCMQHLTIYSESPDKKKWKEEVKLESIRAFAKMLGVEPLSVRIEKQKQLGREPTAQEEIKAIQNEVKKLRSENNDPKKIITEEELPKHLADGWDIQTVLPSGKIVVNRVN